MYERRHVLFCDILGFRDAIREEKIPPEKFLITFSYLQAAVAEANRSLGSAGPFSNTDQKPYYINSRSQHFSDCIVISTPAFNVDAIWLCQASAEIQNMIARRGFLCRGSIETGCLYHGEEGIFGPALVKAVEREKETKQPRIAVSRETVEAFRIANTDEDHEIIKAREYQLLLQEEGEFYVDPFHSLKFFSKFGSRPPHKNVSHHIDAWRKTISSGLNYNCPYVRSKYEWMRLEFNSRLAKDSPWIETI